MALEEKRMSLENDRRKQELEHEMRLMVMMTQMFTRSCASYGTPPPPLPPPEWEMSGYNSTPPFTSMPPHSNQDSTDSYSKISKQTVYIVTNESRLLANTFYA